MSAVRSICSNKTDLFEQDRSNPLTKVSFQQFDTASALHAVDQTLMHVRNVSSVTLVAVVQWQHRLLRLRCAKVQSLTRRSLIYTASASQHCISEEGERTS